MIVLSSKILVFLIKQTSVGSVPANPSSNRFPSASNINSDKHIFQTNNIWKKKQNFIVCNMMIFQFVFIGPKACYLLHHFRLDLTMANVRIASSSFKLEIKLFELKIPELNMKPSLTDLQTCFINFLYDWYELCFVLELFFDKYSRH